MKTTQQQSRKRRKRSLREQNKPPIDRFSSLPDSVLTRILSFLPTTKLAVRTSILARRWRYLWAYVPNLYFINFEGQEIINRVMLLSRAQSINTFRLFYRIDCSPFQLETWITFAIMRNVQRLDLCSRLPQIALPRCPRCLFTCETLTYLGLECCGLIPMSGAVCLPNLKNLYLIDVQYESDESLPHLLSGCPVLEDLLISSSGAITYCKVSSPTIKRLTIFLYFSRHMLEINTPAVRYLEIDGTVTDHIQSGALNSLVEAHVEIRNDEMREPNFRYSRSLLEFIDRLRNVSKSLYLQLAYNTKIIDPLPSRWTSSFRNLVELELIGDYRVLLKFIENADNLEILSFTEFSDNRDGWTQPPQQVPKCLSSRLRIVKFVNIGGDTDELEIIKYLLRNSLVLKRMVIAYHEGLDSEEKIDMLQEISLYQRGSTACEVAFVAAKP